MNEYKRITYRANGVIHSNTTTMEEVFHRLYELEDKLESGLLVELPCKIGDNVYKVYGECDRRNCPYNGYFGQWRCNYKNKQRCKAFIDKNNFDYSMLALIGKSIFVDKSQAEARLKEWQEGKK